MTWQELAAWWRDEVATDTVFATDVVPLMEAVADPEPALGTAPWLDLGCGEGRMMRALRRPVVGCDLSAGLLRTAAGAGPVVRCRLPALDWLRPGSVPGAYAVLVLEHLPDIVSLLAAVHRTVRPGGSLVVVANHPAFTAAGAGPVVDLDDGEVLWRWGPYLTAAPVPTEVGSGHEVTFHHRPLGALLGAAAGTGWGLEVCEERGLSPEAVAAHPGYHGQEQVPRLIGLRWRRLG